MSQSIYELEKQREKISEEIRKLKGKAEHKELINVETNNFFLEQISSRNIKLSFSRSGDKKRSRLVIHVWNERIDVLDEIKIEIDDLISQLEYIKEKI